MLYETACKTINGFQVNLTNSDIHIYIYILKKICYPFGSIYSSQMEFLPSMDGDRSSNWMSLLHRNSTLSLYWTSQNIC